MIFLISQLQINPVGLRECYTLNDLAIHGQDVDFKRFPVSIVFSYLSQEVTVHERGETEKL